METNESMKIFKNGIKIFVKNIPNSKQIYSDIAFKLGASFEDESNNGISHFLEHMIFELNPRTNNGFKEKFEELGAERNACTGYSEIKFNLISGKDQFIEAFTLMADLIKNTSFDNNDRNLATLNKQKKIVLAERRAANSSPKDIEVNNMREAIFKDTVFEKHVLGTEENIQNMDLNKLKKWYDQFFIPENMSVVVAGNITLDEVKKIVIENFDGRFAKNSSDEILLKFEEKINYVNQHSKISNKSLLYNIKNNKNDPDIKLFFDCFENKNKKVDIYFIKNILNKKLFDRLREKEKLVYDINAANENYFDNNIFYINATAIERDNVSRYLNCVADTFAEVLQNGISDEDFEEIKKRERNNFDINMDRESVDTLQKKFLYRVGDTKYEYIPERNFFA